MSLRSQFPFFQQGPIVYLDSAATTQKPQSVIDSITRYYQHENTTVHRSAFSQASALTDKYESIRANVASFIGSTHAQNIIWTKGTTDSINLAAMAWGNQNISSDDLIVVLGSEHHANFVPWQQLAKLKNAHFKVVNVLPNGDIDLSHFESLMLLQPKLVAIQHCSNALGNIYPVKQLVKRAKKSGATTLVDGAQAIAHVPVNVEDIGCDFYAFSGHKMYGPTGIGVLYVNNRIKHQLTPVQFGGEMISHVSIEKTEFRPFPHFLETGTPNIAGIIGLGAALEFIQSKMFFEASKSSASLYQYLINQLHDIGTVRVLGNTNKNIGVVSFVVEDESASDIGALLNEQHIAVRCGHHCAMPLMTALGISGTVRVSLGCYNNKGDIDLFITALNKSLSLLTL
ncbi:cysteine desulfurase [Psychrosphaera algicola]|uniref:Cysteine desulfurase n=1 Tax=Psychrosphaera algicola TaxID=3023714 RepID=A0ABT5F9L6_9GAMM|nr:cysteine desulfurase [Psychrosphaera sp. G1-22]MDC2888225.1 cysteine desulfurase [Psychrosphaera sp. G1-22]